MSEHLLGTRGLHVCSHIVRVGRWTAAQKRMHLEARRHNMERWKRWRGVDAEDAPRGRPPTPTDSPHNCSNIKVRVRPVRRAQGAWPPPWEPALRLNTRVRQPLLVIGACVIEGCGGQAGRQSSAGACGHHTRECVHV